MVIRITSANLLAIASGAKPDIVEGIITHQSAIAAGGILDTPLRTAHFLAQIAHESTGFTRLEESLHYTTAARIRQVWPSRFPTDAAAAPFVRNAEKLANNVYAGRLGNGPPASGDGFRYRGRGLIQNTGRANYRETGAIIGLPLEAQPDLLTTFPAALLAAVAFWKSRDLNAFADRDDIEGATLRINGGRTGLADRREYLRRARLVRWGEGGSPRATEQPASTVLRKGDRGEQVREAQRRLVVHGFSPGAVDGDFGPGTEDAVRQFQSARRMLADGVIGPHTWRELRAEPPARPSPPLTRPAPQSEPDLSGNAGCNPAGLLSRFRKRT